MVKIYENFGETIYQDTFSKVLFKAVLNFNRFEAQKSFVFNPYILIAYNVNILYVQ